MTVTFLRVNELASIYVHRWTYMTWGFFLFIFQAFSTDWIMSLEFPRNNDLLNILIWIHMNSSLKSMS